MASVFISYTRSDSWYADKLYQHLHSFRVNDGGEVFLDRRDITGGEIWRDELDQAIAAADAFVVLLSSDYFTSNFCYEQELPAIASEYANRNAKILPVLVKSVDWEEYALGDVRLGEINAIGPFDQSGKLTPLAEFAAAIQERKFTELADQIELSVLGRPAREQPLAAPEQTRGGRDEPPAAPKSRRALLWISTAAGIATLAAFAIQLYQMLVPADVDPPVVDPPGISGHPSTPSGVEGNCLKLKIHSPQRLPSSLLESMGQQESFPYWFRLQGVNECDRKIHLTVEFMLRTGPFVLENYAPWVSTLDPGESIEANPTTTIKMTNNVLRERDQVLEINLVARDEYEDQIQMQETRTIEILARPFLIWDLRDPEGNRVPAEFTLASLAAWTKVPSTDLLALERQCRGPQARDPQIWVPRCYATLFDNKVSVIKDTWPVRMLFLRDGKQSILPADDVLENGEANPLEAGLALGAMGRVGLPDLRTNIGVIAVRNDGSEPTLYFVWSKDHGPWSGVALNKIGTLSYAQNYADAQTFIEELFSANPKISADLQSSDGIYIDDDGGVVAINFRLAAEHYNIAGLP